MHPIILDLGLLQIRSYGLLLAIAFMVSIYWGTLRGQKHGFQPDMIMDLSIYILISSIIGARLYYVTFHWHLYADNPLSVFKVWEGGLSIQGGVLLGMLVSYFYVKRARLPFYKLADTLIPCLALGQAVGRLGCFFNGCCYGGPCDLPWGVVFPPESSAGMEYPGIAVHPTQLYAVLYSLVICGILWLADKVKPVEGFTFFLYFVLMGIARFSIDFIREFDKSFFLPLLGLNLTASQITALAMIAFGAVMLVVRLQTGAKSENMP